MACCSFRAETTRYFMGRNLRAGRNSTVMASVSG
jgi:hypothetical protein